MKTREIKAGDVKLGGANGLFLIAGPCVIESPEACLDTARQIQEVAESVRMPLIFKASFDKANRSSASSFRGSGETAAERMKEGLEALRQVKQIGRASCRERG